MEVQLKIAGILLIVLGIIHLAFPEYFKWTEDLKSMSLINRQMMYVHTFFIALVVFLMGLLCIIGSEDIIKTKLGKQLSLGFAIFWGIRLLFQFFVYSPKLWKGKSFETGMHIIFSILWAYLTILFLLISIK